MHQDEHQSSPDYTQQKTYIQSSVGVLRIPSRKKDSFVAGEVSGSSQKRTCPFSFYRLITPTLSDTTSTYHVLALLTTNFGARSRTRTHRLLITNQLLYQMSYTGKIEDPLADRSPN